MRTLTLARMGRALMIAAAMIMLPQLASAQLPVSMKELDLQGATSGILTLQPAAVTTSYTLTFPADAGGQGAFLYASNATGTLAWSDMTGIENGWYPRYQDGAVVWTDPESAANPNWSLTGNANAAGLKLGTLAGANGFDLVTDNTARMTIQGGGNILINTTSGNTTIGAAGSTLTVDAGTVDVNSATITIDASTSATITGVTNINNTGTAATNIGGVGGSTTLTGTVDLAGAASLLEMDGDPGASGEVLVSKGNAAAPAWESITEAVGIRKAGVVAFSGVAKTAAAIAVTDLAATDAIIVTLQQDGDGSSIVVPMVTNRTNAAAGEFHITLSGTFTGNASYMVIKAQ